MIQTPQRRHSVNILRKLANEWSRAFAISLRTGVRLRALETHALPVVREGDHASRTLAAPGGGQGFAYFAERDPPLYQPFDREPSCKMKRGIARKVKGPHCEPVVASQDPQAAVHDVECVERCANAQGGHADKHRAPSATH